MSFSISEIRLLIICTLLSSLSVIFSSDDGPTTLSAIVTLVYIIYSFFLPLEQQLYLVALALPNTKALNIAGISGAIIVCATSSFIQFVIRRKKAKIPIGAYLYLLYCLQFVFRFDDAKLGIIMPIKTVMNILFFIVLSYNNRIAKNSFEIGLKSTIALFCGIIAPLFFTQLNRSEIHRVAIEGNDPNMLAIEIAFVFSYFCVSFFRKHLISSPIFIIITSILGFSSLMCGSRMGFILFAFALTISILFNMKRFGKSSYLILIIIITVSFFISSNIGQSTLETYTIRTERMENNDDLTNGRFDIWELYINTMNANPFLWLFGMGDYEYYSIEDMAHNFLIEDIALNGIVGLIIIYFIYLCIFKRQYSHQKKYALTKVSLFNYLPFLVPILGGITLHGLLSIMNTTMLFIGILCLVGEKQKKSKIKPKYQSFNNLDVRIKTNYKKYN